MLRRSQRTCRLKETAESSSREPPAKRKRSCHTEDSDDEDSLPEDNSSGDEFMPVKSADIALPEDDSSGDELIQSKSADIKEPDTLNLSESDSDNDDQDCYNIKAKPLQQSDTESEDNDNVCETNFDFGTLLNSQVTSTLAENNLKSKNIKDADEKGPCGNMDVAKMLSVGEGVHLGAVLNDPDNTKEELKRDDNYTIPENVEITVKLPNDIKCKKGQDMQNLLRRRINTICKETQVLIHKVNLLLWITYGNRLNRVLNSPEVMGSALSLVPSEKAYPPKQCDLNYLENYIKWFSKKIKLSSKTDPLCKITVTSLVEQFSKREAKTQYDLIAMFISMLRSLGLSVRLVINLNAVPIKPNSEQLLGPLTEEDQMKPSCSKTEVKAKQKSSSKSEYFNKKSNKLDNSKKKLDTKKSRTSGKNKKSDSTKSKVEQIDEIISSSDEEDDIFVKKKKNAKSEYFNKKTNKSKTDQNKTKSVNENKKNKNKKSIISEKIDRRVLSTDDEDHLESGKPLTKKKVKNDFWVEVFLEMEEKWFSVDVIGQRLHCIKEIYVSTRYIFYLLFCVFTVFINYFKCIF